MKLPYSMIRVANAVTLPATILRCENCNHQIIVSIVELDDAPCFAIGCVLCNTQDVYMPIADKAIPVPRRRRPPKYLDRDIQEDPQRS